MAARSGKGGRVYVGASFVIDLQSWTWSGLTNAIIEHTAMEHDFTQKHYGIGNFGSVEMVGNYDPDDTKGQDVLHSAALNKAKLTTCYFSLDASGTSSWQPDLTNDSSACAIVSKASNIGFDENGIASIAFTLELGGQWLLV